MPTEVLENFVLGVQADSKDASSDFTTAEHAINLRVDRYGHLIARQPLSEPLSSNEPMSGLAVVEDLIFYVSDGQLYVSVAEGTAQVVTGIANLSGRLSIVTDYEAFVVIADEEGNAYQIHIDDPTNITWERLRLLVPPQPVFATIQVVDPQAGIPPRNVPLFYKFQYEDSDGRISDLTDAYEAAALTGNLANRITVAFISSETDVHTIRAYRGAAGQDRDYRLVEEYTRPSDTTVTHMFTDTLSEADRATAATPPLGNGYPPEATSIVYYNGLIYATCGSSIRWNHLEAGTPQIWNWRAQDSVQRREVYFAIVVGNVLLFGDRQNTWSLTRDSVIPHIRRVGGRGALDTHATKLLEQGYAFVSEDGFYLGDSQSYKKVSESIERRWTAASDTMVRGAVTQFPNDDIHFVGELESGTLLQYVAELRPNGLVWNEWQGTAIVQSAVREPDDSPGSTVSDVDADVVVDSDNEAVTSRLPGSASSHVYFIDGSRHVKEIHWQSQDTDRESRCTWRSHRMYLRNRASGLPEKRWRNIIVHGNGSLALTVTTGTVEPQVFTASLANAPMRFSIRRIAKWMQFTLEFFGPTTVESIMIEYDIMKTRLRRN